MINDLRLAYMLSFITHNIYLVNYFRFLEFVHLVLEEYVQSSNRNVSKIFTDASEKFLLPPEFDTLKRVCIYLSLPFFFASVPI